VRAGVEPDRDGSQGAWRPVKIHDILLVPSEGRFGPGSYSRGVSLPQIAEVEVVDIYMKYIIDELDGHGVRHKVCPTRAGDGLPEADRGKGASPYTLILHCAVGDISVHQGQTTNISRVVYSGVGKSCAEEMSDCLAEWGGLYVHSHKRANPQVAKDMVAPAECLTMRLEPFALNGPHAGEYLQRLAVLGRDIGRLLCEWTRQRGQGALRASTLAW
jgi:hypothetical protein